jgi:hypothetical protein
MMFFYCFEEGYLYTARTRDEPPLEVVVVRDEEANGEFLSTPRLGAENPEGRV